MSILENPEILYEKWLGNAKDDPDIIKELESIKDNKDEISDRFYKNLEFGTGGLRGKIGAGTNRMNVYTVGKATKGLADYLHSVKNDEISVAIGYDSRIKSKLFAETAAGVLAANDVKVYIYPELMPTPMLSYAVRKLHCDGGIVITASHNPSVYNGYKCYNGKGYQMTDDEARLVSEFISRVDVFKDVKPMDFQDALALDKVDFIEDWVIDDFYNDVLSLRIDKDVCKKAGLKVIYTPLCGTGRKPVKTILKKIGIKDLKVVPTQELPDGNFPTCPFPNPEIKESFSEAVKMTEDFPADILLATDPDCDRVGIAVKTGDGYRLMTGNEVGCIMTYYILSRKKELGTLPKDPIVIKTIVTTELVKAIAKDYGCKVIDLLTGFKYIGEKIEEYSENNEKNRFQLGFEESYGYLTGSHVREKDAVNASMIIIEMASYYKLKGKSLAEVMDSIYEKYGIYKNSLLNFSYEGESGMKKMNDIMDSLRENPPKSIASMEVLKISDYLKSVSQDKKTGEIKSVSLPKSNVLSYSLPDDCGVVIRPSGTEPKIKIYVTSHSKTNEEAEKITSALSQDIEKIMGIS